MNKNRYKVIFNHQRGQMMVVQENAASHGKTSSDASTTVATVNHDKPLSSVKKLSHYLKTSVISLLVAVSGFAVAASDIRADRSAPLHQQATVLKTANGLPQINIQTPTKGGVSVNQFKNFNIDERGAILNNSRKSTPTQLGGWIQGNPWLAKDEARVILNQINSQNPSLLNGYLEIGGRNAELIVANPAGIQVNGGGFINASKATLTTGSPVLNQDGQLERFMVRDGNIAIQNQGLNAQDTDFTQILARSVSVDGPLLAKDLQVVAGQNDINANGTITKSVTQTIDTTAKTSAIDTSKLGGMYANKITLISNESGKHIDNKGNIFAQAGGIRLDANGNLINTGTIASQNTATIQAKQIHNQGVLSSQNRLNLQANTLNNAGNIVTADELNARIDNSIHNSGSVAAARLNVHTAHLNNAGVISQTGPQNLVVTSHGLLDNSGSIGFNDIAPPTPSSSSSSSDEVATRPANTTQPVNHKTFANGQLNAQTIHNQGHIQANGEVDLFAYGGIKNSGRLNISHLDITGPLFDNQNGHLTLKSANIKTNLFNNQNGYLATSRSLSISSQTLNNQGGQLHSAGSINLSVSGSLNNQQGEIASNGAIHIQGQTLELDNSDGMISSAQGVSVQGKNIQNQKGKIHSTGQINLTVSDKLNNEKGEIAATQGVAVQGKNLQNQEGKIHSTGHTKLTVADKLANEKGEIVSAQLSIQSNPNNDLEISNTEGKIATTESTSIQSKTFANQKGQVHSMGSVNLTVAEQLNNMQGEMASKQLSIHDTANNALHIQNAQGKITAMQSADIRGQSIDNQVGTIQSAGSVHVSLAEQLNNQKGTVLSNQLYINNKQNQALQINNTNGQLSAVSGASIQSQTVNNQHGQIQSMGSVNLSISGSVNNNSGNIRANQGVHLSGTNLHIHNTGDITSSSGSVEIYGQSLHNRGNIASGNDVIIRTDHDLHLERQLKAGNRLHISTGGSLNNIANNLLAGESEVKIFAEHNIVNRGIINSNGLTRLEAKGDINNVGTGQIYGDHIALSATSLSNYDDHNSAVVAARQRLDIGAAKIINATTGFVPQSLGDYSALISDGSLFIGGKLDKKNHAAGSANHIENGSALISAQGQMKINATKLNNNNLHFSTIAEEVLNTRKNISRSIEQYETRDKIRTSAPGFILAGNLALNANTTNDKSLILVGGAEFKDVAENIEAKGKHLIKRVVASTNQPIAPDQLKEEFTLELMKQSYSGNTEKMDLNNPIESIHITNIANQLVDVHLPNIQVQNIQVSDVENNGIRLPRSSLYTINPHSSGWMVATSPYFANYRNWLGSDYMLSALKNDPNYTHKRLGDAYYEQQLVNAQIYRLTGYRHLNGYSNDEAQFKALMNSGLTAAKRLGLSVGVSLSPEQVSRLTSDIVWMENKTVSLPNGQTETVLVPKVYTVPRKGDLKPSGSLISANHIRFSNPNASLTNSGTISARDALVVHANTIHHSGHLQGNVVQLKAKDNIDIQGGSIQANRALTADANRIQVTARTHTIGDKNNGQTVLNQRASLTVNGANGQGVLALNAKENLTLKGVKVNNSAEHGQTVLTGKDVQIGTVKTEYHESHGRLSDRNHHHYHQTSEVGSDIQTKGNLTVVGDNIHVRQASINSEKGRTALVAKENLNIEAGRATEERSQSTHHKSRKPLSLSRKENLNQSYSLKDEAVASTITGQQVYLGGQNASIKGSHIDSVHDTTLNFKGNVSIQAEENRYQDTAHQSNRKSGFSFRIGRGGISLGYQSAKGSANQQVGETSLELTQIGSKKGHTNIIAGGVLNIEAARLSAGQDLNLQGSEVNLNSAYIQTKQDIEQHSKQRGLAVGINNPIESAKSAYKDSKDNGQFSNTTVGKIMGHADAGVSAVKALSQPSVFISARSNRNQNKQDILSRLAVRTEAEAGGNLNIVATSGNINAQGAKLTANHNAILMAKNDVLLDVAYNQVEQTAQNQNKGWGVNSAKFELGTHKKNENAITKTTVAKGTEISAGGIAFIGAEQGNVTVRGSSVVGEKDVLFQAGQNVSIVSAQNTETQLNQNKGSGIGKAQISDTEKFSGYMKHQNNQNSDTVTQARSQVGSLDGKVNIVAGGHYTQQSSDVLAKKGIDITAKTVTLSDAHDTGTQAQSEKDMKFGQFKRVSSPLLDALSAVDSALNSQADSRTKALQGLAAAAQTYQAHSAVSQGVLVKAESGVGLTSSKSQSQVQYSQSQGNLLKTEEGTIRLNSTEGDIRLKNTQINVTNGQVVFNTANDLVLESGTNTRTEVSKNQSYGAEVGVGASVGAQTGAYIYGTANLGKGNRQLHETTHSMTTVRANHVTVNSAGNTTIKGARVEADGIQTNIGGHLHIESVQDRLTQSGKQVGGGARFQGGYGNVWSADARYNKESISGSREAVREQSGLFAGQDGFDVRADSVHLEGGAIVSVADSAKNHLNTNHLSYNHLENKRQHNVSSTGLSAGLTGSSPSFSPSLPQQDKGGDDSTTYAVLSEGNLNVGGKATTPAELGIRHQSEGAHEQLSGQVDLQAIAQQQKTVAQATSSIVGAVETYTKNRAQHYEREKATIRPTIESQMSPEEKAAFDKLSETKKNQYLKQKNTAYQQADQNAQSWGTGGDKNRAVNAATTALIGILGGQSVSQVAVNTASPYAAQAIGATFSEHGSMPNGWAWLLSHGALGALNAKVNGGNAVSGAVSAVAAEAVVSAAAKELFGDKALVNGKLDMSRLTQEDKEKLSAVGALVGAASGYAVGGDTANAQVGGVVAKNAVENNFLTYHTLEKVNRNQITKEEALNTYRINKTHLDSQCSQSQVSSACMTAINAAKSFVIHPLAINLFPEQVNEINGLLNKYSKAAQYKEPSLNLSLGYTKADFTGENLPRGNTFDFLKGIWTGVKAISWDNLASATGGAQYGMPVGVLPYNQYELENPYQPTTQQEFVGGTYLLPAATAITGKVVPKVNGLLHGKKTAPNPQTQKTMSPVDGEMIFPIKKRTETYFRVEGGGTGNKTSQNRITVNQDGTIKINSGCSGQLCVSTKGADHARYYLSEKRPGGTVVVFEVDAKIHNDIMKNLVPQKPLPGTKNPPNAPKLVDETKPGFSLELPQVWNTILEKGSTKGRVLTEEQFFKEFGK